MSADAHARAPRRGTTALALTAGGAAVILVTLLVSGVTVAEVCLYGAFEALYAVLPGLVLNRARSQRSAPAADTLAVSVPLGLAAQTGAFVLGAALGAPWLLLGLPLPFLAAVAVRLSRGRGGRGRGGRRGRWRALALARVAGGEATVLALVVLGATLIVYVALFAPSPLPRDVDSVSYYPDLVFNVSLAAELLHHWPFTSPSVSGLALHATYTASRSCSRPAPSDTCSSIAAAAAREWYCVRWTSSPTPTSRPSIARHTARSRTRWPSAPRRRWCCSPCWRRWSGRRRFASAGGRARRRHRQSACCCVCSPPRWRRSRCWRYPATARCTSWSTASSPRASCPARGSRR